MMGFLGLRINFKTSHFMFAGVESKSVNNVPAGKGNDSNLLDKLAKVP